MPKHLSCDDKNYIEAVCKLHKDQDLSSPYSADKEYITLVLKAFKKYEKQPNCLDMIHDKMIHCVEKIWSNCNANSLEASLIDLIYMGRFVGYYSIK